MLFLYLRILCTITYCLLFVKVSVEQYVSVPIRDVFNNIRKVTIREFVNSMKQLEYHTTLLISLWSQDKSFNFNLLVQFVIISHRQLTIVYSFVDDINVPYFWVLWNLHTYWFLYLIDHRYLLKRRHMTIWYLVALYCYSAFTLFF